MTTAQLQPLVAVIQGASRGIGLGFVRHLLRSPETHVVATCRNPQNVDPELSSLLRKHPERLSVVQLDVCKEEDIAAAAQTIQSRYPRVDLLVNSSGILNPDGKGETSLRGVGQEALRCTFDTNALGPLLMIKHFSGLMAIPPKKAELRPAVIANISARVGSIGDNRTGGWYAYRGSKAALNMFTKNAALELFAKKVIVVALHPGTVDTDFSRRYHGNVKHKILTSDECVDHLAGVIASLKMDDTGKYLAFDGEQLPW